MRRLKIITCFFFSLSYNMIKRMKSALRNRMNKDLEKPIEESVKGTARVRLKRFQLQSVFSFCEPSISNVVEFKDICTLGKLDFLECVLNRT